MFRNNGFPVIDKTESLALAILRTDIQCGGLATITTH
jgi:hypothetical protein